MLYAAGTCVNQLMKAGGGGRCACQNDCSSRYQCEYVWRQATICVRCGNYQAHRTIYLLEANTVRSHYSHFQRK